MLKSESFHIKADVPRRPEADLRGKWRLDALDNFSSNARAKI